MRTWVVGIGVIAILVGLVWTLQGADVLMGSVMSGSSFWLGAEILVLVAGLLMSVFGARTPGAKKAA